MIAAFPNISNVFCVLMALFYIWHNGGRWFCNEYSSCCFPSHSSSCPDQRKVSLQCISKEPPFVPTATCHKRLHMISVLHRLQWINCTSGHFYCVSTDHNVTGLWLAKDTIILFRAFGFRFVMITVDVVQQQHSISNILIFNIFLFNSQCHFLLQQGNLLL